MHTYHLPCIDNLCYLFALDVNRQAMQTFVLTRLTEARFKKSRWFNLDEYLNGSLSVFKGKDDFEVAGRFEELLIQFHRSTLLDDAPIPAARQ